MDFRCYNPVKFKGREPYLPGQVISAQFLFVYNHSSMVKTITCLKMKDKCGPNNIKGRGGNRNPLNFDGRHDRIGTNTLDRGNLPEIITNIYHCIVTYKNIY